MAVTESQVAGLELERVLPKVRQLFEREDKFYAHIEKRDVEKVSNRQMRVPLEIRPGGNFQYFDPDGGNLGRGGGPTFDKAVVSTVFMSEAIEYTKLAQWATDDDRKAVVNSVRRLTATALDELRRNIDSQSLQDGSGSLATITTVSSSGGVDTYTCVTDGFGVRLMRFGQTVQVYDATLATYRGTTTISFHDVENKIVKCTPAVSGAIATDILVTAGVSTPASLTALLGVPYHHSNASSGTWLGFARSTYPEVRSSGVNAASASFTLPLPRLAVNKIANRMGLETNFKLEAWMHLCQAAAYEEQGQAVILINKQAAKDDSLNMYFGDNMQMAGVAVHRHPSWDKTRIDFVNPDVWGRGEILPIGFYTTDGRKIFELRGPDGGLQAAEIFYMVVGHQLFISNPPATAYIYSLAVPTGY